MSDSVVQTFFDVLAASPQAKDDQLGGALVARGVSEDCAERALVFVPMACVRVVLSAARFPGDFVIPDGAGGAHLRYRLVDDDIFVAAHAAAERLGAASPDVARAAARSAEMDAVAQLKQKGVPLDGIVFTEALLTRLARPLRAPLRTELRAKPWWR